MSSGGLFGNLDSSDDDGDTGTEEYAIDPELGVAPIEGRAPVRRSNGHCWGR